MHSDSTKITHHAIKSTEMFLHTALESKDCMTVSFQQKFVSLVYKSVKLRLKIWVRNKLFCNQLLLMEVI